MNPNTIKSILGKVGELLASDEVSQIERDLALELLREVYAGVKFGDGASAAADGFAAAVANAVAAGDGAVEEGGEGEAETVGELLAEPPAANIGDTPASHDADPAPSLFGEEMIEMRRTEERRVIFSLYGESAKSESRTDGEDTHVGAPAPADDPGMEWERGPAEEPKATGEPGTEETDGSREQDGTEQSGQTEASSDQSRPDSDERTDAPTDASADQPQPVGEGQTVLGGAIGVDDRFIIIRDLFGGDPVHYDEAIAQLDAFDNLDDALIHIDATYRWNPSSEGARLLMEHLMRKLG